MGLFADHQWCPADAEVAMKRLAGTPTLVLEAASLLFFARRMFAATEAATAMVWIAVGLIIVSWAPVQSAKTWLPNFVLQNVPTAFPLFESRGSAYLRLLDSGRSGVDRRPLPPPGSPDDLGLIWSLLGHSSLRWDFSPC